MEYTNINENFKFQTYESGINIYSKVDGGYKYYDIIFIKELMAEEKEKYEFSKYSCYVNWFEEDEEEEEEEEE